MYGLFLKEFIGVLKFKVDFLCLLFFFIVGLIEWNIWYIYLWYFKYKFNIKFKYLKIVIEYLVVIYF